MIDSSLLKKDSRLASDALSSDCAMFWRDKWMRAARRRDMVSVGDGLSLRPLKSIKNLHRNMRQLGVFHRGIPGAGSNDE